MSEKKEEPADLVSSVAEVALAVVVYLRRQHKIRDCKRSLSRVGFAWCEFWLSVYLTSLWANGLQV